MYGMVRPREEVVDGRLLRRPCAAYMTTTSSAISAIDAEVVGDHDDRAAEVLLQLRHQVQDLRLRRHVERRRRLVGDQQVGIADQRHRDHHALAHAAGELVRVVVDARARRAGCRPPSAARARARVACFFDTSRWSRIASTSCAPIVVHRVQRRHRILEDHRDLVAADRPQLARVHPQQVLALPQRLSRRDRVRLGVEAHDRQAGDALAAIPTRRRCRASCPSRPRS